MVIIYNQVKVVNEEGKVIKKYIESVDVHDEQPQQQQPQEDIKYGDF